MLCQGRCPLLCCASGGQCAVHGPGGRLRDAARSLSLPRFGSRIPRQQIFIVPEPSSSRSLLLLCLQMIKVVLWRMEGGGCEWHWSLNKKNKIKRGKKIQENSSFLTLAHERAPETFYDPLLLIKCLVAVS